MARIGLSGTHSTGKTTLAATLKEILPQYFLDINVTRWVRGLGFPVNDSCNDASQEINILKRIAHLNSFPNIIADRTIIDNLAYSIASHELGNLSKESLNYQKALVRRNIMMYDYFIYIPPEIPLELDGVRDSDENYRLHIDNIIKKQMEGVPFYTVSGTTEERVKKIMEIMSEIRPNKEQFT